MRTGASADQLTGEERNILLRLAREALVRGVLGQALPELKQENLTPRLTEPGATFVTLTIDRELRGCIGSLEPTRPLAEDVRVHAVAAALEDYRFPPVREEEISKISIEISRLTSPVILDYENSEELLNKIRPGVDGIILMQGTRRATFLPQVWKKVPEKEIFLSMLCRKMGMPSDEWQGNSLQVFTYQVEEFHE